MVPRLSTQIVLLLALGLRLAFGQDDFTYDPCEVYVTLADDWRVPQNDAEPVHSDDNLGESWYGFAQGSQPAIIPMQCMQDNTCGTKIPLHITELEGGRQLDDIAVGENITAVLCGSYNVENTIDCCVQRQPARIKRCNDKVFIYFFGPQRLSSCAVCMTLQTEVIPPRYLAKYGDRPRSLGPLPDTTTVSDTNTPDALMLTTNSTETTTPQAMDIIRTLGAKDDTSSSSLPLTTPGMESSSSFGISTSNSSPSPFVNTTEFEDMTTPPQQQSNGTENTTSTDLAPTTALPSDQLSTEITSTDLPPTMGLPSDQLSTEITSTDLPPPRGLPSDQLSNDITTHSGGLLLENSTMTDQYITVADAITTSRSTVPSSSPSPDTGSSAYHGGREDSVATTPKSSSQAGSSKPVRFILCGNYEKTRFQAVLNFFLNATSVGGCRVPNIVSDSDFIFESSKDMTHIVDVRITDPETKDTISPKCLVKIFEGRNLTDILKSRTSLTWALVCPLADQCDHNSVTCASEGFTVNHPVFIVLIAVAAACLLLFCLGFLYCRYRRRGTWVLAAEDEECVQDKEKDPEPLAQNGPMTDSQIELEEGEELKKTDTALTANGDRPHTPDDIPDADGDNNWVVPLDQAPGPAESGTCEKSEDTPL